MVSRRSPGAAARRPEPQRQLPLGEAVEPREVVDGLLGGEVLLVGGREGVGHPREHPLGLGAVPRVQRVGEVVGPAAGGRGELGLQRLDVDDHRLRRPARAHRHADDEVQPGEHRLGGPRRVLDARAAEPLEQQLLHRQPHLGRVPVAGQVDQRRPEPAGRVLAEEQPGLPALLQVQHGQRRPAAARRRRPAAARRADRSRGRRAVPCRCGCRRAPRSGRSPRRPGGAPAGRRRTPVVYAAEGNSPTKRSWRAAPPSVAGGSPRSGRARPGGAPGSGRRPW